jgi:Fe-S oxidoreductase
MKQLLKGTKLSANKLNQEYADRVFQSCTMCGYCTEVCQTSIDLLELWTSVRHELYTQNLWPQVLKDLTKMLFDEKNVLGMPNEERNIWALDIEDEIEARTGQSAEVAYYVGCLASFTGRLGEIPLSMAAILEHSKTDYTVLGEEEWCCGNPLHLSGAGEMSKELAEHNITAMKALNVKTLVTTCAGCYRTWKNEYPHLLGGDIGIEVLHAVEFINRLKQQGKLRFKNSPMTVTYHDPCEIGRIGHLFDEPREIIKSIPKVQFTELPTRQLEANCCGGGGMLKATNPDIAVEIGQNRINEALALKVETLVSACPACKLNLLDSISEVEANIKMKDITEIVAKALQDD